MKKESKPDKNLDPNLREILKILKISDSDKTDYTVKVKINGVIRS